jgi:hypothetical protein
MALASATACNQSLDALSGGTTNVIAYVSAHSASPSTTGANELSGGGYARQACTWNAASSSAKTNSSSLTIPNAGSTAVTHFGTWSASTAGTYGIGLPLSSSVTAASITVAAGALSLGAS